MSNTSNDSLIDEARDLTDFWVGTAHADILESLVKANDLEALREAVISARQDAYDLSEPDEDIRDEMGDIY